jgi:hypothetical protein
MLKKIKVYNSFEEQKEDEIKAILAMSMLERIASTVKTISQIYGVNSERKPSIKKFRIIQFS